MKQGDKSLIGRISKDGLFITFTDNASPILGERVHIQNLDGHPATGTVVTLTPKEKSWGGHNEVTIRMFGYTGLYSWIINQESE